jgi:hypothetical protein
MAILRGDREENSKIICGMDTRGEREKGTCKENRDGRSTSTRDIRKFRKNQWRNREEWSLDPIRQLQLLDRPDREIDKSSNCTAGTIGMK